MVLGQTISRNGDDCTVKHILDKIILARGDVQLRFLTRQCHSKWPARRARLQYLQCVRVGLNRCCYCTGPCTGGRIKGCCAGVSDLWLVVVLVWKKSGWARHRGSSDMICLPAYSLVMISQSWDLISSTPSLKLLVHPRILVFWLRMLRFYQRFMA